MASVSRFLTQKLRLKVNEAKSAVARLEERKFLGFSISNDGERAAHRAKSPRQIQGANPGDDKPDSGAQPTADHRGTDAIPRRVARLLRLRQTPRVLTNLEA